MPATIHINLDSGLPKIIWFLWLQGVAQAPLVVRRCHESWIRHNPGWQIIFLDQNHIAAHSDLQQGKQTIQAFSDRLRINLLAEYGGVWADATLYCNKSLDDWLPEYMGTGFFAFSRPGPDRMISSWFMAASVNNYMAGAYQKKVNAYWSENPGISAFESSKWHLLNKFLRGRGAQVWFSGFVLKVLRVYPYFWFHYLFETIYLKDSRFTQLWDQTAKVSADIPHRLQTAGLFIPLSQEIKTEIDSRAAPVYKLSWKAQSAAYQKDTVVAYLLER